MKGLISNVRGTKIGGSLIITKEVQPDQSHTINRLNKEFPGTNQQIFSGIIPTLAKDEIAAYPREEFVAEVKRRLLRVAISMWPDREYDEKTSFSVIVNAIETFLAERHTNMVEYQWRKKNKLFNDKGF